MDGLIGIGQLSADMGISIRTIRYYEELDMIKPARTTDANYRYYGAAEREKLGIIVVLKQIGFSLHDIKTVLADNRRETMMQMMGELQRKTDQEMARIIEKRERLQSLTESMSNRLQASPLEVIGDTFLNKKESNKGELLHYLSIPVIGIGSRSAGVLSKLSNRYGEMNTFYLIQDHSQPVVSDAIHSILCSTELAEQDWLIVREAIQGREMLFIIATMDDEWGCAASAFIAKKARELGIVVICILPEPVGGEADRASELNGEKADLLFKLPMNEVNEFEDEAVNCMMTFIRSPFYDDEKDIEDMKNWSRDLGCAQFGSSRAAGPDRIQAAVNQLLRNEQLSDRLNKAEHVLLSIAGACDFNLFEVNEIAEAIMGAAHPEADMRFVAYRDEELPEDGLLLTVVAAGTAAE
ncbi:hypothetical protein PCCS19_29610 [Paenibacillus sp. CCS19]|uniref:MerR family transcriptional regulator n=1 Tax=Paenibacillus sp. CCS19 TaxID=3158387 RepID=UPI00255E4744|nr:MerR family transcriptional regulator [Paenibacillus cellulosilyticus]GMK39906.1 hypothetical protein PCCS19_29610 [Paenibacillus cellulosilyticus]